MPLWASAWPDQAISTVGSFDQASMTWLGLVRVGFDGGVASILNGPRWTAALQLPALSPVRRWNHHWARSLHLLAKGRAVPRERSTPSRRGHVSLELDEDTGGLEPGPRASGCRVARES